MDFSLGLLKQQLMNPKSVLPKLGLMNHWHWNFAFVGSIKTLAQNTNALNINFWHYLNFSETNYLY
jgi:hypothetical protein